MLWNNRTEKHNNLVSPSVAAGGERELLYVRTGIIIKILCSVHTDISVIFTVLKKTSFSSLYRINGLDFIIITEFVYCAVRSESV